MTTPSLEERLGSIHDRIAAASERSGRAAEAVRLIGVSKKQPAEAVAAAVRAGLRDVAENFAQEARGKIPEVARLLATDGTPTPTWHFVGQLQRNKVRLVAPHFDVVASVDRLTLAEELSRRAAARDRPLEILLQVKLGDEVQKGGVAPAELGALLGAVGSLDALRVTGLMTVPAIGSRPEDARNSFRALRALRDDLSKQPGGENLHELSMGMSADFEVAVEEGATQVRVGQAIFGPRG